MGTRILKILAFVFRRRQVDRQACLLVKRREGRVVVLVEATQGGAATVETRSPTSTARRHFMEKTAAREGKRLPARGHVAGMILTAGKELVAHGNRSASRNCCLCSHFPRGRAVPYKHPLNGRVQYNIHTTAGIFKKS